MTREMLEYLNGERNVVQDVFILGREKLGNSELIFVSLPEDQKNIYSFWNSRQKASKYEMTDQGVKRRIQKGTGGKPAYVMLMLEAAKGVLQEATPEAKALFLDLLFNIDWNTGKAICLKSKKKAFNQKMMCKQFNISRREIRKILFELTTRQAIYYNPRTRAYYLNRNIVKKGVSV